MRENSDFIDLLKTLIRQPSVVGSEQAFFRVLHRELEERGARVSSYHGVLVAQGNKPKSAYFSAHVDRHGLICTGPNEFQYAAFVVGNRSDLLGNSVSEKLMDKIMARFEDTSVYAYSPISGMYLGSGQIKNTYICEFRNNLVFEVDGLSHLMAGTPVAFQDKLTVKDNHVYGQLDNVLTVAHLVYLFEHGFEGTAFFTAQEESGSSWRFLLEWFRRFGGDTERLMVLDTSSFPDKKMLHDVDIVLRKADANAKFNQLLSNEVAQKCTDLNITTVFKDDFIKASELPAGETQHTLGSTELGRIIAASKGYITGTTIQIPTTNYHTLEECCRLDVNSKLQTLLQSLIKS